MKTKKNKNSSFNLTYFITFFLVGGILGLAMMYYLDSVFEEYGFLLSLAFKLIIFLISYYVQMIIHELGHLVAGLLSGYKFGSFRAGSIMFVKEGVNIKIKRQSVAGTGGQCLMTPPPMNDGDFPFVFYNLGGVLMNIITLPLCVIWFQNSISKPLSFAFSVMMFFSGLIVALTNGIPLKLGMINNDGSNIVELRRNKEARVVFHNQFMMLDGLRRGVRLREMPKEWFSMPSDGGLKNSIAASGAMVRENWLMDCGKRDEALVLIDRLLDADTALIGLHRSLLVCDKVTVLLIRGGADEQVRALISDKQMEAFFKQMKTNPSVARTQYAIALLLEKNERGAAECLVHFEKCAKMHPYPVEIITEREIVSEIKNAARGVD